MKASNLTRTALSIAAVAIATGVFTTSATADFTIYSDDFSGSGGVLNGTTPDIALTLDPFASLSWYAGETTFFDDGTVDSDESNPLNPARGGGAAYLPLEPEAGRIYTLSADINNLTLGWVGFGFVQNPYNAYIDDDSGRHEQGAFGSQWIQVFPAEARMVDSKTSGTPDDSGTTLDTVSGLTGTNSFEIVLDTNDPGNVQVSFSVNDSLEHTYNAGPLATMGYSGGSGAGNISYGIKGVGFSASGCCTYPVTTLDGIDNLLLISDGDVPPVLGLEVDTSSGEITMKGNGSSADNINYYQITSDLNQLDPTEGKWNSLADQNLPAFVAGDFNKDGFINSIDLSDPDDGWEARFGVDLDGSDFLVWQRNLGNGTSTGWEEGGSLGPHVLAEGILVGESTIDAGASISLGDGYTGPATGDLKFIYRTTDGSFRGGDVSYVGAAAAAVPEPSSLALVAVGLLGLGTRRRKRGI